MGVDPEQLTLVDSVVEDETAESDEPLPFTYDITSYGADYTVDSLIQRLSRDDIVVPDFQRAFVWNKKQADRFVESLLLGLPVPGIFFATDEENRLLVLDGQQRLKSLKAFYDGSFGGQPFELEDVQERFRGKSYATLEEEDRRRLDNSILHATVVRQDQPSDDQSSIYFLFERINTGGTALDAQEVRFALYRGAFNDLLAELNRDESWRHIYGRASTKMKDQELILRFFAFKYERDQYSRPMERFLSGFMARNRKFERYPADVLRPAFVDTIHMAYEAMGGGAFRLAQTINAAVFDSTMVGLSERLANGPIDDPQGVADAYAALKANDDYIQACSRATADIERVRARINLAIAAFAEV